MTDSSSPQARIAATIADWQKRLLQLDRRNNLLYHRRTRSSVPLVVPDIDEFLVHLTDAKVGLSFQYAEQRFRKREDGDGIEPEENPEELINVRQGDIDADCQPLDLQRRLRNLWRKDREWEEEQGLNVLFLAVGFLTWIDEDDQEASGPILLVPCDLHRASPRDPFYLTREADEIALNVTLVHKLSLLGIELPNLTPIARPAITSPRSKDWSVVAPAGG